MDKSEALDFLRAFQVPNYRNVFILGCFARYATVCSQQIAIVGAGASGLTAAAGAQARGIRAIVLERRGGILEFLRNNRQRWLHPHIYDWPNELYPVDEEARLPLLNWTAGYADDVALQIETGWNKIRKTNDLIEIRCNVRDLRINEDGLLSWEDDIGAPEKEFFDAVIFAIGFGLEEKSKHSCSYWSEDDLDCEVHPLNEERWLISGAGDGALTDLMRLCIRGFRHASIKSLFSGLDSFEGVRSLLKDEIYSNPEKEAQDVDSKFRILPCVDFGEKIKEKKRTHGPQVFLLTREPLYGCKSTVLNRLVVLALQHAKLFTLLKGEGKVKVFELPDGKLAVKLDDALPEYLTNSDGGQCLNSFDRVILRHGPVPALKIDPKMWEASTDLRAVFEKTPHTKDETRKRKWDWYDFSPTGTQRSREFKKFGVSAEELFISQELRSDGNSTLHMRIKNLLVHDRSEKINGIYFSSKVDAGMVGEPDLDPGSKQLGHEWKGRVRTSDKKGLNSALRERRKMTGTISFTSSHEQDVGLRYNILNGHALTEWESRQLYGRRHVKHVDGEPLGKASEFLARLVWLPVERLVIRMTLPGTLGPPKAKRFECDGLPRKAEIDKDGFLHLGPLDWNAFRWTLDPNFTLRGEDSLKYVSDQTWELKIVGPSIGSWYSLDWSLPASMDNASTRNIEEQAEKFRKWLLTHRPLQKENSKLTLESRMIRKKFREFCTVLNNKYRLPNGELGISLMTYDSKKKCLMTIDGLENGNKPSEKLSDFRLPFGGGQGGACFRLSRYLVYVGSKDQPADQPGSYPRHYVPLRGLPTYEALISVPIDHPDFAPTQLPVDFDRSRQCVGIINVGSVGSKLPAEIKKRKDDLLDELFYQGATLFKDIYNTI